MVDLILAFLMLIIPLFWLRVIKRVGKNKTRTTTNKNPSEELIGGTKLFFALLIGSILLSLIFTVSGVNDLEKVSEVIAINSQNLVLYLVIIIIMVFVEEFFFRSFLIKQIGVFPSSLIFGIAHAGYYSIAQIIGAFALGLILAYWFNQNRSITQNYLGHLFYNFFAIATYLIFR